MNVPQPAVKRFGRRTVETPAPVAAIMDRAIPRKMAEERMPRRIDSAPKPHGQC